MFEVLMFLFENYMEGGIALDADTQTILIELEKAGFERIEIDRALDWLEELGESQTHSQSSSQVQLMPRNGTVPAISPAIRHFLPEEAEQLGLEGQGFLLHLEQIGILDPVTREMVIDRVMALDDYEVYLGRVKWVVLMVLFNLPNKKSALSMLQDMILSEVVNVLH